MPMITSADELVACLEETGVPWDAARWRWFLELAPDEQVLEVRMLQDSGEPPPRDTWYDVVAILTVVMGAVGVVAGIASGAAGVAGAISAVQGTVRGMRS